MGRSRTIQYRQRLLRSLVQSYDEKQYDMLLIHNPQWEGLNLWIYHGYKICHVLYLKRVCYPWLMWSHTWSHGRLLQVRMVMTSLYKKHQTCHNLKILLSDRNADNFTTISLTIDINLVFKTSFKMTQT